MWNDSEIDEDNQYVLLLLEDSTGRRYIELSKPEEVATARLGNPDFIFSTAVVPHHLIAKRNLPRISEEVTLADGSAFYFDAHSIWFTMEEVEDIHQDRPVRWVRGRAPKLASK